MIDFITHPIVIGVAIFLVSSGLLLWILTYFVASYCIYNATLRNKDADKWTRELPDDIPEEQKRMYEIGKKWSDENIAFKKDLHIVNNGLNLYGEYYDFGYDRCVMILSGRTESLKYGYYFAIPYAKNRCNVLVFDPRGHGLSEGEFNTVGFEESRDDIAWVKYIKNELGVRSVIFHGICIGAAGGMLAITDEDCPDCVDAIVTEGMFINFAESMKNHLIERKKPVFILLDLVDMWMKHYTGHSMKKGPIDVIAKLDKPLLMLQGKKDIYSTPENGKRLYDLAGTDKKELVYFDEGKHSMLRITDTERYDNAITAFIEKNFPIEVETHA